ncbi:MAG: monomethylamine:corrinoid methyltransferase, partial [Chloroflexota bacterium]
MPNLIDFMERATSGPIVVEDEFNLKRLIPNTRKIVKEYNITYSPENPVAADDSLADRLFEAAIEFIIRTGIYCDDTNRVIQIEKDEI